LGQSSTPTCAWRGVLFATGNNITIVGDLDRKGLICTLDHNEAEPETHPYIDNPIKNIMQDRGKYVAAALTIARAYQLAKDKIKIEPYASYDEWSKIVREPLVWLVGKQNDPKEGQKKAKENDPERIAANAFFIQWTIMPQLNGNNKTSIEETPHMNYEFSSLANANKGFENWEPEHPDLYYALAERCADKNGRIDAVKIGYWLRSLKGHVHANHRLEIYKESKNGNSWVLIPLKKGDKK